MKYGYVRVSTTNQNTDRQIIELEKFNIPNENIYSDYQSGKDFNRIEYQKLKKVLNEGDILYIKSIDRLGRNYEMIKEEWAYLTKTLKVSMHVIDMPILNTKNFDSTSLTENLIQEIVLTLLSYVAENERVKIKERQREGIYAAKLKGKHLGRPKFIPSENFDEVLKKYKNKQINLKEALSILSCSKSSFYKYAKINRK